MLDFQRPAHLPGDDADRWLATPDSVEEVVPEASCSIPDPQELILNDVPKHSLGREVSPFQSLDHGLGCRGLQDRRFIGFLDP